MAVDQQPVQDEELAVVVRQLCKAVDGCNYTDDGVVDYAPLRRKRGMPAGDSQSAKTKLRQKMALVHQKISFLDSRSRHMDDDGDFEPTRRGRPAGSKSAKSNMEQKPALFDSSSRSGGKSDKDDNLEPSDKDGNFEASDKDGDYEPSDNDDDFELTRKRKKPGSCKSGKIKKSRLVDRRSSSSERKKAKDDNFQLGVSNDDSQKKYARVKDLYGTAWETAVKVNEKLPAQSPSFVKLMLKSHVDSVFCLGLPVSFSRIHLPEVDVTIELEDEDGDIYETNYLVKRKGLSGEWGRFAQQDHLKVSDALVFQLVRPKRFKVYMLREDKFTATDGALSLLSLNTFKENNISQEDSPDDDVRSKEDREVTGHSSKGSDDDINCQATEEEVDDDGIGSSDKDTGLASVKSLRDFKIIVDGSIINRKLLPDHVRKTYYKLCCERKAFLHRHLRKDINPTLAVGFIVDMVNIANGIRACTDSASSLEDLVAWKNILEYFELLGMDVAFMCECIDDLLALFTTQSTSRDLPISTEECERYEKMKLERDIVAEQIRALESRMSSVRKAVKEIDVAMKEMESSAGKKREQAVRKLAAAPW